MLITFDGGSVAVNSIDVIIVLSIRKGGFET